MIKEKDMSPSANKKYELTGETRIFRGIPGREVVLYRIRALRDIETSVIIDDAYMSPFRGDAPVNLVIHKGDLGGWVESEKNLDQHGNAWIADEAYVTGDGFVTGNAFVGGHAWINDHAVASDDAMVIEKAQLHGYAIASGHAIVRSNTVVAGYAIITGYAIAKDDVWIFGNANVRGSVIISGYSHVNIDISKQADVPKWYPARTGKRVLWVS